MRLKIVKQCLAFRSATNNDLRMKHAIEMSRLIMNKNIRKVCCSPNILLRGKPSALSYYKKLTDSENKIFQA
jgi:hypothetical protein